MGVSIKRNSLKFDNNVFTRGKTTAARIFYTGFIDALTDNPVKITLEAPGDGDPIFFKDGQGVEAKAIVWDHNFTTTQQEFFMDVDVVVDNATGPKARAEVVLTADVTGSTDSDSEFIFHKS